MYIHWAVNRRDIVLFWLKLGILSWESLLLLLHSVYVNTLLVGAVKPHPRPLGMIWEKEMGLKKFILISLFLQLSKLNLFLFPGRTLETPKSSERCLTDILPKPTIQKIIERRKSDFALKDQKPSGRLY